MKKTFRKLIGILLVFSMFVPVVGAFASEETADVVEITFKLGESILTINGKEVEVETPYAVGAGVTLVPVRVITEAFGAKVGWEGATQTIPIEYPDVNIVLQIGNKIAEVNGNAETLLASPEISGGRTMVPLRFISETFGAEVSYDADTKAITVTKKKSDDGSIVEGGIESLRIGDSYYGWTMERPAGYVMSERSFSGDLTYFDYNDECYIGVYLEKLPENYNAESDFNALKAEASKYTLVAAEKTTEGYGVQKFRIKYKDKNTTLEDIYYIKGDYKYNVFYDVANDLKEEMAEASRIIATFRPDYIKDDCHDMSDVKNGYRTYKSEAMKYNVDIPVDFDVITDEDVENKISFASLDDKSNFSRITLQVYSKAELGSAKKVCESDYNDNKLTFNEDITRFKGGVSEVSYKNFTGYEYNYTVNGEFVTINGKDVHFEVGDYVYNINISLNSAKYDITTISTKILNSIEVQKLDPEETGVLLRYYPDRNSTYEIKGKKWSLKAPVSYETLSSNDTGATFADKYSGTTMVVKVTDAANIDSDIVSEYLKQLEEALRKDSKTKLISRAHRVYAGGFKYNNISYERRENEDGFFVYGNYYCELRGGKFIEVSVLAPECSYSQNTKKEISSILETIVIEP